MKALSVQQPWAQLLLNGDKTIEVRSWATKHSGELLICASAAPKDVFFKPKGSEALQLYAGAIIGIVNVIDCRLMVEADNDASCGNYSPGAWAWIVEPVCFCEPSAIKGGLGLFNVVDDKIVRLNVDDNDFWDYPLPQGEIKFNAQKHYHIEFD